LYHTLSVHRDPICAPLYILIRAAWLVDIEIG